jgi:glyoxylase-like metal-dependent hydrolase (beta-lactamase superfamily II)/predicted ester cyclase
MAAPTKTVVRDSALAYFDAIARRDLDAMAACWEPGAIDRFVGGRALRAPDEVREYFGALFDAIPDLAFEVLQATTQGRRCAVQWRLRGTFAGPGRFQGLEPTGARLDVEGCDVVEVGDEGRLTGNSAYVDSMDIARQLGAMPPLDSPAERRMSGLVNTRTRVGRRFGAAAPKQIAAGVWLVKGGVPRSMNAYLLVDEGGITLWDTGIAAMAGGLAAAAARLGGLRRIVLSHAHADHRGACAQLRAPVFCHPDEVADVEGDAGRHYGHPERFGFPPARVIYPRLVAMWDGGPVPVSGTINEGDDVAGFRVVAIPGHSPGQIALWRESDRLALAADCFTMLDVQTGRPGGPNAPHPAFNYDDEQARESMRTLAALEPAAAWPGHGDALTGDVRGALERAADA